MSPDDQFPLANQSCSIRSDALSVRVSQVASPRVLLEHKAGLLGISVDCTIIAPTSWLLA